MSVVDKDDTSWSTYAEVEGQILGIFHYQDPQIFDFDMTHNRLIPTLQKGRHTISVIINSLKRSAITYSQML